MNTSSLFESRIELLYDKYSDMLFRLCLVHLGSRSDAEDAVQDVFEKFINNLPVFNDDEHEKAWFIRVAINCCHDRKRKKAYRNLVSLDSIEFCAVSPPEEYNWVLNELIALPEKYKAPLLLHYIEGYSIREIAAALELTESAVKVRLYRAREKLKIQLEEECVYV